MERPIFKPLGTAAENLDPSSMVVDISVLDKNIRTMHSFFSGCKAKLRPCVNAHLSPAIAHKQLSAGETCGIAVHTLSQAEVFAEYGFSDILLANLITTPPKIKRLSALTRTTKITVAVDSLINVNDLSNAAITHKTKINVVVCLNNQLNSIGIEPGKPAIHLAKAGAKAEGLYFSGLMAYNADQLEQSHNDLTSEPNDYIHQVLDTKRKIENSGIDVTSLSIGGTRHYKLAAAIDDVTDILAGTYALMSESYRTQCSEFKPAASILSIVVSTPESGVAVIDAGRKAIGSDSGLPVIQNVPGATVKGLSAEHGIIELTNVNVNIGDKIWVLPWDIVETVNLHDYMQVVRDGNLEAVWDVPARGTYR